MDSSNAPAQRAGKTAIITGAARGIGRAIAKAYLDASMNVVVADILGEQAKRTAGELDASGARTLAVAVDVTNPDQVESMRAAAVERFGGVDVLVNNAGSLSALGPIWEVEAERWLRDAAVNLNGTFLCCRAMVPELIRRGGGYVINLIGAGVDKAHVYTSGYDTSKAGVARLTETLAREAGELGVKAFTLFPGTVLTEMTRFILNSPEGRKWRPTFKDGFEKGNDLPPELAAELAVELISGKADALSGRYFTARAGLTAALEREDEIVENDLLLLRLRPLP